MPKAIIHHYDQFCLDKDLNASTIIEILKKIHHEFLPQKNVRIALLTTDGHYHHEIAYDELPALSKKYERRIASINFSQYSRFHISGLLAISLYFDHSEPISYMSFTVSYSDKTIAQQVVNFLVNAIQLQKGSTERKRIRRERLVHQGFFLDFTLDGSQLALLIQKVQMVFCPNERVHIQLKSYEGDRYREIMIHDLPLYPMMIIEEITVVIYYDDEIGNIEQSIVFYHNKEEANFNVVLIKDKKRLTKGLQKFIKQAASVVVDEAFHKIEFPKNNLLENKLQVPFNQDVSFDEWFDIIENLSLRFFSNHPFTVRVSSGLGNMPSKYIKRNKASIKWLRDYRNLLKDIHVFANDVMGRNTSIILKFNFDVTSKNPMASLTTNGLSYLVNRELNQYWVHSLSVATSKFVQPNNKFNILRLTQIIKLEQALSIQLMMDLGAAISAKFLDGALFRSAIKIQGYKTPFRYPLTQLKKAAKRLSNRIEKITIENTVSEQYQTLSLTRMSDHKGKRLILKTASLENSINYEVKNFVEEFLADAGKRTEVDDFQQEIYKKEDLSILDRYFALNNALNMALLSSTLEELSIMYFENQPFSTLLSLLDGHHYYDLSLEELSVIAKANPKNIDKIWLSSSVVNMTKMTLRFQFLHDNKQAMTRLNIISPSEKENKEIVQYLSTCLFGKSVERTAKEQRLKFDLSIDFAAVLGLMNDLTATCFQQAPREKKSASWKVGLTDGQAIDNPTFLEIQQIFTTQREDLKLIKFRIDWTVGKLELLLDFSEEDVGIAHLDLEAEDTKAAKELRLFINNLLERRIKNMDAKVSSNTPILQQSFKINKKPPFGRLQSVIEHIEANFLEGKKLKIYVGMDNQSYKLVSFNELRLFLHKRTPTIKRLVFIHSGIIRTGLVDICLSLAWKGSWNTTYGHFTSMLGSITRNLNLKNMIDTKWRANNFLNCRANFSFQIGEK